MPTRRRRGNQVLRSLPSADRELLERHLVPLALVPGTILYEPGAPIDTVFFPHTGQVSLIVAEADGRETESAAIGTEGLVGLGGVIAGGTSFTRQQVQLRGDAVSITREEFLAALEASGTLRRSLAAHYDAFAAQLLQSAMCLGTHQADQRVARWLLTAYDTVAEDWLELTQDALARSLGFTRPTITLSLNHASAAGLLRIERGRIVLVDRAGLEAMACCCYAVIRNTFDQSAGEHNGA